jgi:uncharacterized protein YbaA (DUF1428 family)
MEWARDISVFMKTKYGLQARVMLQIGGQVGRFCWSIDYPSLADFEATMDKMMADPDYQSILGKFGDFFLTGETHDALWSEVIAPL